MRVIQEGSFNRVREHMHSRQCAFITAYRSEYTHDENQRRNKKLAKDIKDSGLQYMKCQGGFIENKGTPDETDVTEDTFIVFNTRYTDEDFKKLAINLCGKYNQDSVLITTPKFDKTQNTDDHTRKALNVSGTYYTKDGSVDMEFNDVTLSDIDMYFTKVFGKKFALIEDLCEYCNESNEFGSGDGIRNMISTGRRSAEKEFRERRLDVK